MTDFEKAMLEELRILRLTIGGLAAQVNLNEGTLKALVVQVEGLEAKVDALPQVAEKKAPSLVRDGGIGISGGAVAAIIAAFVQHWAK
jgi:hypothetical protein